MRRLPTEEAAKLRRRFIDKLVEDVDGTDGLRENLHSVIVVFDGLVICIEHGLCDQDSAAAFFSEYSEEFWSTFAAFIEERRGRAPGYGIGIETFANWSEDES